jgi:hypothetical protein
MARMPSESAQIRPNRNAAVFIFSMPIDRDKPPPIIEITPWIRNPATISGLLRDRQGINTS